MKELIDRARAARTDWSATSLRRRLKILRGVRHSLAEQASEFAVALAGPNRTAAQAIVTEILPLADSIAFLERHAPAILRPKKWGRRLRPFWLSGAKLTVQREPFGVVLIVAPSNYPLFLPAVQAVQALAAGNAVVVKPAPECASIFKQFARLLDEAGLPSGLLAVADDDPAGVAAAVEYGVDHVVLTGSSRTGAAVLGRLAPHAVSATVELSGCDAVFVLAGADLAMVEDALAFGVSLNGGATCIAPRRVFVDRTVADELERRLAARFANAATATVPRDKAEQLWRWTTDAVDRGARLIAGGPPTARGDSNSGVRPILLTDCSPDIPLLQKDVFAPWLAIVRVDDTRQAVEWNETCPYALGAAVFGEVVAARQMAKQINAGVVIVNDLIVPHADPRLPFAGRKRSGFGVTRGAEGLLAMTRPKAVVVRSGKFRPHFDQVRPEDEMLFLSYLRAAHGGGSGKRLAAMFRAARLLIQRGRIASTEDRKA